MMNRNSRKKTKPSTVSKLRNKGKHRHRKGPVSLLTVLLAMIALVLALFIIALAEHDWNVQDVFTFPTPSPTPSEPGVTVNREFDEAGGIAVVQNYIPYDSPRRTGEIREIKYVTIHETDNRSADADAAQHALFLTSNTTDITAWHYTVDDHSIYHHIPDNEIAWNAGDSRTEDGGNMNGIGIEMCVNYGSDFEQTMKNTAWLAAKLLVTYDLTPDDVRLHADFMDKECPHRLISEGRVPEFYQMIRDCYHILKEQSGS